MTRYFTNPHQIADALQAVVDDLRALPDDVRFPETTVDLGFQPHMHYGTPKSRMLAVDLLGWATTGETGAQNEPLYRIGFDASREDGICVSVYTDPRPGLCGFDFSHTRDFCGNPDCRES